jgi:TPR repeat protein
MSDSEAQTWEKVTAAIDGGKTDEAISWLKQLANGGDWRAAWALGAVLESKGTQDSRYYIEAAHWYTNALAKEDRPEPNLGLARYYYHGLGGYRDFRLAYEHSKRAQPASNYEAVLMMAEILLHGAGASRDLEAAEKLFRNAADAGYPFGLVGLAKIQKARSRWFSSAWYAARAIVSAAKLTIRDANSARLLGLGKKHGRLALDGVVANIGNKKE